MSEHHGPIDARRARRAGRRRRPSVGLGLAPTVVVAMGALAGCHRAPPSTNLAAKGGYFAFGNVELYRQGPSVLTAESGITDVQYAVLVPFAAVIVAALASTYAWAYFRRRRRRADWALPLGSVLLALVLGAVGWSSMSIETVVDEQARTLRVVCHHLWGAIPMTTEASLDRVQDVHLVYRSGRGAYCASMVRLSSDDGAAIPLFRFVDILTDELDLATCERVQQRLAIALGTTATSNAEERFWW